MRRYTLKKQGHQQEPITICRGQGRVDSYETARETDARQGPFHESLLKYLHA